MFRNLECSGICIKWQAILGKQKFSKARPLKLSVCRLIAYKSALAALVDSSRGYETGEYGRELSEDPDGLREGQAGDAKLSVSAGHNKLVAKDAKVYAITDMPKQFGVPPESSLGDGLGEAQAGSGKLVVPVVKAAPNLCALVGEAVARKLIGTAGDHIGQTEIFQSTPPALKLSACRLIANKSALAARVDSSGGYETGEYGRELSEKIRKQIEKWREPSLAKQPKFDAGDDLGQGQAGDAKLSVSAGHNKLAAKDAKVELSNSQVLANQLGRGTQSTYFFKTGTLRDLERDNWRCSETLLPFPFDYTY
ncbi:hypothetical protein POM88_049410 [Heracleum sosnowskyi]|uniref:Nop domain-containing protein n=1 Tax=Heracleum sosnowskyi TaxID=360622 RepID=A0AAD8GWV9_9APIA|nr:hypothetical protein POM88_049410 [Heracleum sosnowskyi]